MSKDLPSLTIVLGNLPTFARLELTRLLRTQPDLHIIGVANRAEELPVLTRQLRPELLIVGDSQLLGLEQVARQYAVPILLCASSVPMPGMLREIAQWGVYDYISQMPASTQPTYWTWQMEVLRKIRSIRPQKHEAVTAPFVGHSITSLPRGIVVVGASTGGVQAVEHLVSGLAPTLQQAVVVAVHLPAHFMASFVARLGRVTSLPVVAGQVGTPLEAGKIVVVLGGQNIVVRSAKSAGYWPIWQLDSATEANTSLDDPSINMLMSSAAKVAGRNTLGVILSGLGQDGTLGAQTVRQQGGLVVVQDEASSAVFSMPKSVIQAGWADEVLALSDLSDYINRSAAQRSFRRVERSASPSHTGLR